MIKYIPMTDEQFEIALESRIEGALDSLNELSDESVPPDLLRAIERLIESYDFSDDILNDDYNLYLDMVDGMASAERHGGE